MSVGAIGLITVAVALGLGFVSMGLMMIDAAISPPPTVADLPVGLLGLIAVVAPPAYGLYLVVSYLI